MRFSYVLRPIGRLYEILDSQVNLRFPSTTECAGRQQVVVDTMRWVLYVLDKQAQDFFQEAYAASAY
jgi:hypothetical protein